MIAQDRVVNGLPARRRVAAISVSCATYDSASMSIIEAAKGARSLLAAATSIHGLSLAATDQEFGQQLSSFDLVTPDGQPVRWALNLLHHSGLKDRVCGPTLMLKVCGLAADLHLGIYLYGSRPEVLQRLVFELQRKVPGLRVMGYRSPPFRPTTHEEDEDDVLDILRSGAHIVFVGLGCPRQERWAYAHRDRLPMPLVCVGAAFDIHAGMLRQAPGWMQGRGLEWLFRLMMEPRRLWRRYATHIPIFLALVTQQYLAQSVLARTTNRNGSE